MSTRKIVLIPGDGIGPEITAVGCTRMVQDPTQFDLLLIERLN